MQIYKAHDLQFKYIKHCVAFINSYVKFNNKVLLISLKLDMIFLALTNSNKQIRRQFLNNFKVS